MAALAFQRAPGLTSRGSSGCAAFASVMTRSWEIRALESVEYIAANFKPAAPLAEVTPLHFVELRTSVVYVDKLTLRISL